jgi:tetratricopeptide (TPR) repeat protein
LEQIDSAIGHYKLSLRLDPNFAEALYGMAYCLDKRNKWFEAHRFVRKAVKIDELNGDYWFLLADVEAKIGNISHALESYEKASVLDPDNPDIWVNWSLVFYEQEDYEKAYNIASMGLGENPKSPELHYHACVYLINQGKYKEALDFLQNALILDFEMHPILFEFFTNLEVQKGLYKIIEQYKDKE